MIENFISQQGFHNTNTNNNLLSLHSTDLSLEADFWISHIILHPLVQFNSFFSQPAIITHFSRLSIESNSNNRFKLLYNKITPFQRVFDKKLLFYYINYASCMQENGESPSKSKCLCHPSQRAPEIYLMIMQPLSLMLTIDPFTKATSPFFIKKNYKNNFT